MSNLLVGGAIRSWRAGGKGLWRAKNLDITAEEYGALLRDLEATLGVFQYVVGTEPENEEPVVRPVRAQLVSEAPAPQRSALVNVVLIGLLAAALIGVALAALKH